MSRAVKLVSGGSIGAAAAYVYYDYKTCHPMRSMTGYEMSGAWIRLVNNLKQKRIVPVRKLSLEELSQFDGEEGRPTYFASDGYIWDVSSSEMFKSAYGKWTGKDATVALARMSMDASDVNRTDWESLSKEDWESCRSWTKYFTEKYSIIGRVSEFDEKFSK